jgi:hypothetical protein
MSRAKRPIYPTDDLSDREGSLNRKTALTAVALLLATALVVGVFFVGFQLRHASSPEVTVEQDTSAVDELNDHLEQQEYERALNAWSRAKRAHDLCVATKRANRKLGSTDPYYTDESQCPGDPGPPPTR